MKKSMFLKPASLFLFLACGLGPLAAAPYGPDGRETRWIQPGGAALDLRVFGDEYYARTETRAGFTVVRSSADNAYHYAELSADGTALVPSATLANEPPPAGLPQHLDLPKARIMKIVGENRTKYDGDRQERWNERVLAARRSGGPAKPGDPKVRAAIVTGAQLGLTILVQFPDDSSTPGADPVLFPATQAKIENLCNQVGYNQDGNTGSVRDFFYDQSAGKLTYTQTVTQIITVPRARNYYNFSDYPANTTLRQNSSRLLLADAIDVLVAAKFDFTGLTTDIDGRAVATNVFFAGADSGVFAEGLWPQQWSLPSPVSVGTSAKRVFIHKFQITNAEDSAPVIGTFCHENGHLLLNYPDLYDYGYDSAGVGRHCLMGSGSYNNGGKTPSPINAYFKSIVGWSNVKDVAADDLLTVAMPSTGNVAYRFSKPGTPTEYFILENRGDDDKWAAASPDKGIAIWHIDETVGGNENQEMTPNSHYQVSLEQADGAFDLENGRNRGDGADLFDQATRKFSNTTIPDSKWWSGGESGLIATVYGDIGASTRVVFSTLSPDTIVVDSPDGGEVVFRDSIFTITWRANITGNLKIELYKGGVLHSVLSADEPNDRSFDWAVPEALEVGSDYSIRISGLTNAVAAEDYSNAPFKVTNAQFPAGGAVPYGWFMPGSASSVWKITKSAVYEGTRSLVSGKVGDGKISAVAYRSNFKAGNLSFYMMVSSEKSFDFARFYIDGVRQVFKAAGSEAGLSGKTGWIPVSLPISAGDHTFKWTFEKDDSYAGLKDAAWLDGVSLPETTQEIAVADAGGLDLAAGMTTSSFPDVVVGSASVPQTFTIKNVGAADLFGLAITKEGANLGDFVVGTLGNAALAPGESTTFQVVCAPTRVGPLSAGIRILSNDEDEAGFLIGLAGTGQGGPQIGVFAADGTKLRDDGKPTNFGHGIVGSAGKSRTFTIRNRGEGPLRDLAISKSGKGRGDFRVSPLAATSLAPGASVTFQVTFHASARNEREARIEIRSNDPEAVPFNLNVSGIGARKSAASPAPADGLAAAFGSLSNGNPARLPQVTTVEAADGQKYLALTVTRQAGKPDAGTVEVSPDLLDWFSGNKHTTVLIDNATTLKVRDNTPAAADVKRYIRLK